MEIKFNCLQQMRNMLSLWVKQLELLYRKVLFKYETFSCESLPYNIKLMKRPIIRYKFPEVSFTNLSICEGNCLDAENRNYLQHIKGGKKSHSGTLFLIQQVSLESYITYTKYTVIYLPPHGIMETTLEVQDAKLNTGKQKTLLQSFSEG